MSIRSFRSSEGFSLIEISVALLVIAILLGAIMVPLNTQVRERRLSDTSRQLEEIKDALLAFAAANGRLPCPADPAGANAVEVHVGGDCTFDLNGLVPAVTLGLTSTDAQGYSVDPWGNRIRYAVSDPGGSTFTTIGGIKGIYPNVISNISVCSTNVGTTAVACNAAPVLTSNAVAIIFSLGPNGNAAGASADEVANVNNDRVFVFHTPSDAGTGIGEFDDVVTWISPYLLYSKMMASGRLP